MELGIDVMRERLERFLLSVGKGRCRPKSRKPDADLRHIRPDRAELGERRWYVRSIDAVIGSRLDRHVKIIARGF